jgi:hypothetical protein
VLGPRPHGLRVREVEVVELDLPAGADDVGVDLRLCLGAVLVGEAGEEDSCARLGQCEGDVVSLYRFFLAIGVFYERR